MFDSWKYLLLIYFYNLLFFFIPIKFEISDFRQLISKHTNLFQQGRAKYP